MTNKVDFESKKKQPYRGRQLTFWIEPSVSQRRGDQPVHGIGFKGSSLTQWSAIPSGEEIAFFPRAGMYHNMARTGGVRVDSREGGQTGGQDIH